MDKVCVKEDDCDTSIREYFRKLREDQRLFDVTLATDDGKQVQAHRAILCAGSNFFSDILLRSNYTNVIVYLKGIISAQLECVLAFLYNGEAFIPQMELEQFLETGKELEVKGLLRLGVPGDNEHNDQISGIDDMVVNQEGSLNNTHEYAPDSYSLYLSEAKVEIQNETKKDLDIQIEAMIEKVADGWKCKTCCKTMGKKQAVQRHAERHLEGVLHSCQMCSKTFSNRPNLQTHIYGIHSKLFSCDPCGKSGMNKKAYRWHTQNH